VEAPGVGGWFDRASWTASEGGRVESAPLWVRQAPRATKRACSPAEIDLGSFSSYLYSDLRGEKSNEE